MNFSQFSDSNLLYTSFNQTKDCVVFGTKIGFYVYKVNPFQKIIARKIPGGVSLVKLLYKSNIILFVGTVEQGLYPNKKLIIWDDHKRSVIGEILFKYTILNINVTHNTIFVVTLKKIYIYNFENLFLLKTIDTCDNPRGLCSITYTDNIFIAYPGERRGEVNITKYNTDYLKTVKAHQNSIQLFTLSADGKFLATCSEVGTLIRIFEIQTNKLVKEVRRGTDTAQIIDLQFSDNLQHILCSSLKGTIHLFSSSIDTTKTNVGIGYGISYFQSMLPSYFSSEWSFTQFHLDNMQSYSVFSTNPFEIVCISNTGCFYILSFREKNKKIIKTCKFISDSNDPFSDRTSTIR